MAARILIVVMGVSGSGKTTVGRGLAEALKLPFLEADDLHSAHNVEKMRSGRALTDEDRKPWLAAIAQALQDVARYPAGLVVSCSALKRSYREQLRQAGALRFVFLDVSRSEAERRLRERPHHFMPPSLVPSQFADLEAPTRAESDVIRVEAAASVQAVRAATLTALRREPDPLRAS